MSFKIKKGDSVVVLSGKDKGKNGKVLKIIKNSEHAKGYMVIVNKGKNEVYLTGGKAFFSKELFLHKEDQNDISVSFNLINHLGSKVSETNYEGYSKVFFFGFIKSDK